MHRFGIVPLVVALCILGAILVVGRYGAGSAKQAFLGVPPESQTALALGCSFWGACGGSIWGNFVANPTTVSYNQGVNLAWGSNLQAGSCFIFGGQYGTGEVTSYINEGGGTSYNYDAVQVGWSGNFNTVGLTQTTTYHLTCSGVPSGSSGTDAFDKTVTVTVQAPTCSGGQVWNGSACSCPGGQVWNGASCVPGNQAPVGTLDGATNGAVSGWVFDPDSQSSSISVHFYIDGGFVAAATANIYRGDVNNAYGLSGNHGFYWTVPSGYCNGASHSVAVYGIDTSGGNNTHLSGSPKSFTCNPTDNCPAQAPVAGTNSEARAIGNGTYNIQAWGYNLCITNYSYNIYHVGTRSASEVASFITAAQTYLSSILSVSNR